MAHPTEQYFNDVVSSIVEAVKFDSSLKPAVPGCPFGKETADCLAYFLNLASKMGFETHNYDNYVGEVIYGEGEPLAILAHLDVVPAGEGWSPVRRRNRRRSFRRRHRRHENLGTRHDGR